MRVQIQGPTIGRALPQPWQQLQLRMKKPESWFHYRGRRRGRRVFFMNKGGRILPGWDVDFNGARGAVGRVDFLEAFSQLMDSDTDDCVRLGIEIVPASECFNGERGLGDLAGLTLEMLLTDELQHSSKVVGACPTLQNSTANRVLHALSHWRSNQLPLLMRLRAGVKVIAHECLGALTLGAVARPAIHCP